MFNVCLEDFIIDESFSVIDALRKINYNGKAIVFVCKDRVLLATVTDGDARRFILKNGDLNENVMTIANVNPRFLNEKNIIEAERMFWCELVGVIPIVDNDMRLVDVLFKNSSFGYLNKKFEKDMPIVIMAGGKGARLAPYTDILPKPLVSVNGKPIVEHIIEYFERFGSKDFYFVVNYKKEFIKAYFADDKHKISFFDEIDYLGTGGGLSLLKDNIGGRFFISNCDILIDCDYTDIVKTHIAARNLITVVCAQKEITIPYGVFETNDAGNIERLIEKPKYNFLVNAGMYLCEPELLKWIPDDTFIHMTEVIQELIKNGEKVGVYKVSENNWMDMGTLDEFKKMQAKLRLEEDYE